MCYTNGISTTGSKTLGIRKKHFPHNGAAKQSSFILLLNIGIIKNILKYKRKSINLNMHIPWLYNLIVENLFSGIRMFKLSEHEMVEQTPHLGM